MTVKELIRILLEYDMHTEVLKQDECWQIPVEFVETRHDGKIVIQ